MSSTHCRTLRLALASLGLGLAACGGGGGGGGSSGPSSLSYADGSPSYSACVPISANLPTVGGGPATSFSVTPPLPAGLALDAVSGAITGTPTALLAPTSYTVTASNGSAAAAAALTIEVVSTPPAGLSYGAPSLAFAVGVSSSYAPALSVGFADQFTLAAGSLPTWLALDPLSGELQGVPDAAALGTVTAFTVRAHNCLGEFTDLALSVGVARPVARSAAMLSDAEPVLSSYLVDALSGALRSREHALTSDAASGELCAAPDGRHVFVAEGDYAALRSYVVGATDARLSDTFEQVSTGAVPASALAVRADSRFLYCLTNEAQLRSYAIPGGSGALSEVGQPLAVPEEPSALALDPLGRFAFVAGALDGQVASFALDALSGAPSPVNQLSAGASPAALAVSHDSNWLVCANAGDGTLSVFAIHPASGALAPAGGGPFATPGGRSPAALYAHPSAGFVYAAHAFDAALDAFAIQPGGSLAPLPAPTTALPRAATRLAGEPDGARLHVLIEGWGWLAFDLQPSGSPSPSPAPRNCGRALSRALAFVPGVAALAPRPEQLHVAAGNALYGFDVAPDGALAALSPPSLSIAPSSPTWIEPHPWLEVAYVTSNGHSVTTCTISASGSLSVRDAGGAGVGSRSIHIDPSGRFAYELLELPVASVRGWAIDPVNGALSELSTVALPPGAGRPAFSPAGTFVHIPCRDADTIESFAIDWATGELVPWITTLTGDAPSALVIDESGSYLACLEETSSAVAVYGLDPLSGVPVLLPAGLNDLGSGATTLALDPSGEHVFVGGLAGATLRAFALDRVTGALFDSGSSLSSGVPSVLRAGPDGRTLYAALASGLVLRAVFAPGTGFTLAQTIGSASSPTALAVRARVR